MINEYDQVLSKYTKDLSKLSKDEEYLHNMIFILVGLLEIILIIIAVSNLNYAMGILLLTFPVLFVGYNIEKLVFKKYEVTRRALKIRSMHEMDKILSAHQNRINME